MDDKQAKKELKTLAEKCDRISVTINDPAIDTIKGDFVLGPLLRLIAASLVKIDN